MRFRISKPQLAIINEAQLAFGHAEEDGDVVDGSASTVYRHDSFGKLGVPLVMAASFTAFEDFSDAFWIGLRLLRPGDSFGHDAGCFALDSGICG